MINDECKTQCNALFPPGPICNNIETIITWKKNMHPICNIESLHEFKIMKTVQILIY